MRPFRRLTAIPDDAARPPSTDHDDRTGAALIRAGRGDEAAFGQYYDLTVRLVNGIVLRVVRDPAISEETVQDIYLELWRLAPRFDQQRGSAKSWTATIAHRRAVDRVRSEQARRDREEREGRLRPAPYDQVVEEVTDRLERSQVERALAELSPTQKEAVTMAYYGGKTYREVAALLGIPEGTAKTRIRDGLIKLRDRFGAES